MATGWLEALRSGSIAPFRSDRLAHGTVFDLLQSQRRRYAFHYLRQQEGAVGLAELSEHVAAWENDTTVPEITPEARQRVYVSLFQTHLPRMAEAGVVEFDDAENTVRLSETAAAVEIYLETVPEADILWAHYYLGVTALGSLFVALVWGGVAPFAEFHTLVWIGILGAFTASATIHHMYLRKRRLGTEGPPPSEL